MNFKERFSPKTEVKVVEHLVPRIGITSDALVKMFLYVDGCNDEIGWLGTVKQIADKHFIIDDVYLFDQDVHGATTEITPEGLSDFGMDILQREDGMEIWNNMKMWGHSHVRMGVSPSGQDDAQMREFSNIGHDWFIRLIANKNGEMKLDFYDYSKGIAYFDVPWSEIASQEEEEVQHEIFRLQRLLEQAQKQRTEVYKTDIEVEMKAKVRKMSYTGKKTTTSGTTQLTTTSGGNTTANSIGFTDDKKKESETSIRIEPNGEIHVYDVDDYEEEDLLVVDEDVHYYLSDRELILLAQEDTIEALHHELQYYGWSGTFTMADLMRIHRVAREVARDYEMM